MVRANDATSSDSGTRVTPSSVERPMGFDNVFQIGQFKGKTYWDVLRRQPQFYVWAKKEDSRVPGIQQYVQWVDQFFEFRGGEIYPVLPGSAKKGTAKSCQELREHDLSRVFASWAFIHREKGREIQIQA